MSAVPREIASQDPEEALAKYIHRPPGRLLVRYLVHTSVTPIQVTVMAGIFGIIAGVLLVAGAYNPPLRVAAGVALLISCILDCTDGELARARKRYSLVGMMLDGLTDNVVGTSVFLGMAYNVVVYTGNPWMWLLGIAAGLSAAAHVWVFDAKKKQYLYCLGLAHPQEIQPVSALREQRRQAQVKGEGLEAFLLGAYIFFRQTQRLGVSSAEAVDPVRFWQANRHRMRAWIFMGSSAHFFLLYVAAIISPFWPPALLACVLMYTVVMNAYFIWLVSNQWDVS